MPQLTVDIWSDVVCPWCYIGKRRFEAALEQFEHRDDVTVLWHSFELDSEAPPVAEGTSAERLAGKYGMSVEEAAARQAEITTLAAQDGLTYDLAESRGGNTFDAHRLIHLAAEHGLGDAAMERLMRAYFSEREPIGDRDALQRLAVEVGLPAEEVREVLDGERYADAVRADERAATQVGIRGVPFFVLGRKYGVSGAQPSEVLLQALQQAWDEVAGPPVNA
jgi:predicted DsbA family dithiol-disulfide isomerase